MKTLIIIALMLFSGLRFTAAQQIVPFQPVNPGIQNALDTRNDLKRKLRNLMSVSDTAMTPLQNIFKEDIRKNDSIINSFEDSNATVVFFGGATLNSTSAVQDLSAATRFMASLRLSDKFNLLMSYNVRGVKPTTVAKDSLDNEAILSFMFPEASSSGFLISLSYKLCDIPMNRIRHTIAPFAEFAFRQARVSIKDGDSSSNANVSFSTLNYTIGFRYLWQHIPSMKPENAIAFGASPYLNVFNIPDEDAYKFEKVLSDSLKRSAITSLGVKFTLQYKGFTFFADFRANTGTKNLKDENIFKGFVYNIGTLISTDLFRSK